MRGLTSFNKNNRANFSGEKGTMKFSSASIFEKTRFQCKFRRSVTVMIVAVQFLYCFLKELVALQINKLGKFRPLSLLRPQN